MENSLDTIGKLTQYKDLSEILNSIKLLISQVPSINPPISISKLPHLIELLTKEHHNLQALSVAYKYYSSYKNFNDIQQLTPRILSLCNEQKKLGYYFELIGNMQLIKKEFKEAKKSFEQALLYESNSVKRQQLFFKIAYSLYKQGSLQSLHYLSTIKTSEPQLLGQILLLEGFVYDEILKNSQKALTYYKRSCEYFHVSDDKNYYFTALHYLATLYDKIGNESEAELCRENVNQYLDEVEHLINERDKLINETPIKNTPDNIVETQFLDINSVFNKLGKVSLPELEKLYILHVIENAQSLEDACKILNIDRKTLYNKRKSWRLI